MGFFFRKSIKLGPFRINLSKSGVGVSGGITGARISKGPRGTHLHLGRHGVYYRKKLDGAGRVQNAALALDEPDPAYAVAAPKKKRRVMKWLTLLAVLGVIGVVIERNKPDTPRSIQKQEMASPVSPLPSPPQRTVPEKPARTLIGRTPMPSATPRSIVTRPSSATSDLVRGPRGGCYHVSASGRKVYVDRSLCN